jgi:general secretion pathway protein C
MRDARIRPYFAIGKAAGVRIDRIRDESIIRKMGLRDGDIIKGVNGFGLHSPTKVFEAYRRYKNDSLIQLQLIRDEEPITLTYNIIK